MAGFTIRRARADEAGAVFSVIEDGRRAIAALGIEQWQHGHPDFATVEADIAAGACWVAEGGAETEGALLGTCAICLGRDADYVAAEREGVRWLTRDEGAGMDDGRAGWDEGASLGAGEPPYVAVHRCAVAAGDGRRGVMGALLMAAERVAREEGRASLRMDTHPGNVRMRGFLAKQGFTELGSYHMVDHPEPGDAVRIAYEKVL